MKKLLLGLAALVLLVLAYLLLWPSRIDPVAWTPPTAPKLEGVYAENDVLKKVQRFGVEVGKGPEGIAVDAAGRIYAGYEDGRVVMFSANGASYQELMRTHGRPLGITFGPNGGLVVADAQKGLLHLGGGDKPKSLLTEAEGAPIVFADDVDNTVLDKNVYLTDVSARFPLKDDLLDILEHSCTGRLIQYNVAEKTSKVLLKGLCFPNGVAVGPDDAYVLVTETAAYRITRYWLKGEKAGTSDVFADNLPGIPDNLSYGNGRFWVALYAPRDPMLDQLLPGSQFLRKVISKLPHALAVHPQHKSWVLGFDLEGKVIANLQYAGSDAYAPITSVEEWGPWLYFGSLTENSLARLPLNDVIPGSPTPPSGWEQTPATPHHFQPPKSDEDEREEEEAREREEAEEKAKAAKEKAAAPVAAPAPAPAETAPATPPKP